MVNKNKINTKISAHYAIAAFLLFRYQLAKYRFICDFAHIVSIHRSIDAAISVSYRPLRHILINIK